MTRSEAIAFLTELFEGVPAINSGMIEAAIDASRVVDANGRAPLHPEYVETIDGWWAASMVANRMSIVDALADTKRVVKFSTEGSSFEVTGGRDWSKLAAHFRSMSPLGGSGGLGVIEIDHEPLHYPRSSGTTDDPMWWEHLNAVRW
ncbi:hypothetical protein ACQCX2_07790 [Propionibacteriaceae bacterium Y1700]|uniref:hypothetical protein n=1 Tax=Microlunatus sp. Y1700 TaxID=3418487 RepID=UPI003DA76380